MCGMAMSEVRCFGCGALVSATHGPVHAYMLAAPGCWALYGSTLEEQHANDAGRQPEVSQWLVDAYAAQHATNTDRRNRQSVALHLVSLCAAFEHSMPAEGRRQLIGQLAHREYPELQPSVTSFAVTVRDVADAANSDRARVVRRWARASWDAWAAHHETVRSWLSDETPAQLWGQPSSRTTAPLGSLTKKIIEPMESGFGAGLGYAKWMPVAPTAQTGCAKALLASV